MQHDDVIWTNIHHNFCSYKVKTVKQAFCRNKYNLTGLCERGACPLANSRYATIVEDGDDLLLFVKTVERAHSPRNLWEKIKLSKNYKKALAQIDTHLEFWPTFYIHKAKQRLTKMTQYFIRRRRLALRSKTRLVGVKKKIDRREAGREKKAINAAKLEKSIEKELLERLRSGTYGDIYNFPQEQYEKVLDEEAEEMEFEEEDEAEMDGDDYEAEYEVDSEDESLDDIEDGAARNGGNDFDFDDESEDESRSSEDGSDMDAQDEDIEKYVRDRARRRLEQKKASAASKKKKGRSLRGPAGGVRVEVEVEHETEGDRQRQ